MAYINAEFLGDEEDKMREAFAYLEGLLEPRSPKPPIKNAAGKWHFYIESPGHKRKTKANRKYPCNP